MAFVDFRKVSIYYSGYVKLKEKFAFLCNFKKFLANFVLRMYKPKCRCPGIIFRCVLKKRNVKYCNKITYFSNIAGIFYYIVI